MIKIVYSEAHPTSLLKKLMLNVLIISVLAKTDVLKTLSTSKLDQLMFFCKKINNKI